MTSGHSSDRQAKPLVDVEEIRIEGAAVDDDDEEDVATAAEMAAAAGVFAGGEGEGAAGCGM